MDNIIGSTKEMLEMLKKRSPNLQPLISHIMLNSLDEFCLTETQKNVVRQWVSDHNIHGKDVVLVTEIDIEKRATVVSGIRFVDSLDAKLFSLEKMMALLANGNEVELNITHSRFLDINDYNCDISEGSIIFYEVYHLAYAVKVLLSNIPGMRFYLGKQSVPFPLDCNVGKLLDNLYQESSLSAHVEPESLHVADTIKSDEPMKQKRKRKRGKN